LTARVLWDRACGVHAVGAKTAELEIATHGKDVKPVGGRRIKDCVVPGRRVKIGYPLVIVGIRIDANIRGIGNVKRGKADWQGRILENARHVNDGLD
jgi:hypothetical protein